MGIELWSVHPSYPVDFEINQDFISSFYEQDKNLIYKNKQTKQKQFTHGILPVTPVSGLHPDIVAFQRVLV